MSTAGTKKKKMLLSSSSGDGAIRAQNADSFEMLPESVKKKPLKIVLLVDEHASTRLTVRQKKKL